MLINAAKAMKALSDPNRIRIIEILSNKEMCVCEITSVLNLATSTVSNHLSILRNAGIIEDKKDGKWVNYRVKTPAENQYVQHVLFVLKNWVRDSETVQKDKIKSRRADRNQLCK